VRTHRAAFGRYHRVARPATGDYYPERFLSGIRRAGGFIPAQDASPQRSTAPRPLVPAQNKDLSAGENVFTILQGLFDQLEKGVDDLGSLTLCKNVFGQECFHNLGFGQSH
jgi:hypothetical protein